MRKCRYCDFYSVADAAGLADRYLCALQTELQARARGMEFHTVYVGGGTPTSLSPDDLRKLVQIIGLALDPAKLREFTVEANPGTVDDQKLEILRTAGVNRLSLGLQSLNPVVLRVLGRIHTPEESRQALAAARRVGFTNLSVDLIFAVPRQTLADLQSDLDAFVALNVPHVSAYCLTYEEGTPLWSDLITGALEPLPEDTELEMYRLVRSRLAAAGYEHYEISNFARPGFRSIHNQVYWRNEPYLGVGAAATSYLSGRRFTNVRNVTRYLEMIQSDGDPVEESEVLDAPARARETLIMGLRMLQGVSLDDFARRTGFSVDALVPGAVNGLKASGLVRLAGGKLRLTERGVELANEVFSEFV